MSSLKRKLSVQESGVVKKMARAIVSGSAGRSRYSKRTRPGKVLELKEFEVSIFANNQIGTGGSVTCLNQVTQGSDIKNRIGRHINMLSVDVTVCLVPQPVSTFAYDYVYCALVHDAQSNGTAPAFSDIYQSGTISQVAIEFRNTSQFRDRFTILWEERSFLSVSTGLTSLGAQMDRCFYRKHYNLTKLGQKSRCEFNTSATGVGNSNSIYFVVCSYQNAAALGPYINASSKLIFSDP